MDQSLPTAHRSTKIRSPPSSSLQSFESDLPANLNSLIEFGA
jgi:hypothetical protein